MQPAFATATIHAFDKFKFIDSSGTLQRFFSTLSANSAAWPGNNHFSPYLALINSTMTGKSRLCAELKNCGVFTVTWCLRENRSHSLRPRRTTAIADWIEQKYLSEINFTAQLCRLLLLTFDAIGNFIIRKAKNLSHSVSLLELTQGWADHSDSDDFWDAIIEEAQRATATDKDVYAIIGSWKLAVSQSQDRLVELLKTVLGAEDLSRLANQVGVVFIVDEARRLNYVMEGEVRFHWFRRACQVLPRYASGSLIRSFVVVSDTTSKLSNLAPSKHDPISARSFLSQELYQPFWLVDSMEVWFDEALNLEIPVDALQDPVKLQPYLHSIVTNSHCSMDVTTQNHENSVLPSSSTSTTRPSTAAGDTFEVIREPVVGTLKRATRPLSAGKRLRTCSSRRVPLISIAAPVLQDTEHSASPVSTTRKLRDGLTRALLGSFEFMTTIGRAALFSLFCSIASVEKTDRAVEDFVTFLSTKLLLDLPEKCKVDEVTALSVLGTISNITLGAESKQAAELAAERMRLIANISPERDCVYTLEAAEPALAFTAHYLFLTGKIPWYLVLYHYAVVASKLPISTGYLGELFFEILSHMTWQVILSSRNKFSFHMVPVMEFLETMLKSAWDTLDPDLIHRMRTEYQYYFVRPYQYIKLFVKPSRRTLLEFFLRGCCMQCKEGEPVIDFIIPIFVENPDEPYLTESRMTAMVVQVKLWREPVPRCTKESWKQNLQRLKNLSGDFKIVAMFIEYNLSESARFQVQVGNLNPRLKGYSLFVRGLSPRQIFQSAGHDSEPLKQRLDLTESNFRALLNPKVDPAALHFNSHEISESVCDLFQLNYSFETKFPVSSLRRDA
jgi:hypothetical protein